jgi:hypothetical protein
MGGPLVPADVVLVLARGAAAGAPQRPRSGPDELGSALEAVVDAVPPGPGRHRLLVLLAERRPDLIVRRATDWLTDDDTDVLIRLPHHFLRLAVAHSLRPWSRRAIDTVVGGMRGDPPVETRPVVRAGPGDDDRAVPDDVDVVARVMADQYPELMRPTGLTHEPSCSWRVIDCEVWEWTLWRCQHGHHALEAVVSTGHVDFHVAEVIDDSLVQAWRRDGPVALDPAVERMRVAHRVPRSHP